MNLSEPADLVMPRTTGAVLRVLAGADTSFSVREAARIAGVSAPRALEIINHAEERGLVIVERAGQSRMCRLNRQHLAAGAIVALVTLRSQILERIRLEVESWEVQPAHASLFGSVARGDGTPDSDLDVLVVRTDDVDVESWERQLSTSGERLRLAIGNTVSWFDVSRADLRRAVAAREELVDRWRSDGVHLAGSALEDVLGAVVVS